MNKTASPLSGPSNCEPLELCIVAEGVARLTISDLVDIRKRSIPSFAPNVSPPLLKHSDEQTLASLVAVSRAIEDGSMRDEDFSHWAVVSSSRYLGRSAFSAVIDKYQVEGPWGVSVQVIPHRTPHAVSGTISLALENHGPSIGADGGPGGEPSALLCVASLLRKRQWLGAWVVFSAWSPELTIDRTGHTTSDSACLAAALAIVRRKTGDSLGRIRIRPLCANEAQTLAAQGGNEPFGGLTEFLTGETSHARVWHCSPGRQLRIEVELTGTPGSTPGEPPLEAGESRTEPSLNSSWCASPPLPPLRVGS